MIKDEYAKQDDGGNQQAHLHLPAHATKYRLDTPHQGDLVKIPISIGKPVLFVEVLVGKSGETARYASHVPGEKSLVMCSKGRMAVCANVSHLGRFPRNGSRSVGIGRTRATAVIIQARAGPPATGDR
jgi:hypothetical protein